MSKEDLRFETMAMQRSQQDLLKTLWLNRGSHIPRSDVGVRMFCGSLKKQGHTDENVKLANSMADVFLSLDEEGYIPKAYKDPPMPTVFEKVDSDDDAVVEVKPDVEAKPNPETKKSEVTVHCLACDCLMKGNLLDKHKVTKQHSSGGEMGGRRDALASSRFKKGAGENLDLSA